MCWERVGGGTDSVRIPYGLGALSGVAAPRADNDSAKSSASFLTGVPGDGECRAEFAGRPEGPPCAGWVWDVSGNH